MSKFSRRDFLKITSAAGAVTTLPFATSSIAGAAKGAKVVVIGGGYGGATAAKYIKVFGPEIDVTLVEPNKEFYSCPASNWVLGGIKPVDYIKRNYDGLKARGINVVHDLVTSIDPGKKKVKTKGGQALKYDRLVVSPGIDFKWDGLDGYGKNDETKVPHAWKAGEQTLLLKKQLMAMPDGGTFVIVPPPNPFRCPPGPGERISLVAHYMKKHKPKSKIIALDVKGKFSKQGHFGNGWKLLYDGMIDYRKNVKVTGIDVGSKTVKTSDGKVKADVLNVIPAQKAGAIAQQAGLTGSGDWCQVDHLTWESKVHKNIHVIGDSSKPAKGMPKSGYMANSEAKVCAAAVVDMLQGKAPRDPSWVNTCYSLVAPNYGISVAAVYGMKDGKAGKVKGAGGLGPKQPDQFTREMEAVYAESWVQNILFDIFG